MSNKNIVPYSSEWYKEAYHEAMNFCPRIYPCAKCNHPVVDGYCCNTCGDSNPHEKESGQFNINEEK